jgi:hypothetical protein
MKIIAKKQVDLRVFPALLLFWSAQAMQRARVASAVLLRGKCIYRCLGKLGAKTRGLLRDV